MEIKKTTLFWAIPVAIAAIIIGAIAISSAVEKNKKERAQQEFRDDIERRIDREYRSLKSSFEYYAEIACDWDRSDYSRDHAAKKMYELTDIIWNDGWRTYRPYEMKEKIQERKTEIEQSLRSKARQKVRNEYLGN